MPKITTIIPKQHFEIIRDRIAAVLIDELNYQFINSGNYTLDVEVEIEGNNVYADKVDTPLIIISLMKGNWSNESIGSSDGVYIFAIDIYSNSKSNNAEQGDKIATLKLQRIAGVVRAILKNPVYKTLDFTTPFIMRTTISEMNIGQKPETGANDALNTMMGQLQFVVTANENTSLLDALMIEDYKTQAILGNTKQGYVYEGFNY